MVKLADGLTLVLIGLSTGFPFNISHQPDQRTGGPRANIVCLNQMHVASSARERALITHTLVEIKKHSASECSVVTEWIFFHHSQSLNNYRQPGTQSLHMS